MSKVLLPVVFARALSAPAVLVAIRDSAATCHSRLGASRVSLLPWCFIYSQLLNPLLRADPTLIEQLLTILRHPEPHRVPAVLRALVMHTVNVLVRSVCSRTTLQCGREASVLLGTRCSPVLCVAYWRRSCRLCGLHFTGPGTLGLQQAAQSGPHICTGALPATPDGGTAGRVRSGTFALPHPSEVRVLLGKWSTPSWKASHSSL